VTLYSVAQCLKKFFIENSSEVEFSDFTYELISFENNLAFSEGIICSLSIGMKIVSEVVIDGAFVNDSIVSLDVVG